MLTPHVKAKHFSALCDFCLVGHRPYVARLSIFVKRGHTSEFLRDIS